jgi:hypothetical protein
MRAALAALATLAAAAALCVGAAAAQTAPQAAAAAVPADPARLAVATRVVARLLPQGVYQRMMGESLGPMMDAVMGSVGDMPVQEVVRMSGISEDQAAALGQATLQQVLEIYDPHWKERMTLGATAMSKAMGEMMVTLEPGMREALARTYAREFSIAELTEMDRFFASPAGAHYADKSMALFMDPEMMTAMTKMVPEMTRRMPDMVKAAEDATRHLAKPRGNEDLSAAERAKLAQLLGVAPEELEANPPALDDEDAADAAGAVRPETD